MNGKRRGFTIVELLVVAALMATLFGLVLAGGRPKPTARKFAQEFASMLLAAQSRALGNPEGAAVIIEEKAIHEAVCLPPRVVSNVSELKGYRVRIQRKMPDGVLAVTPWLDGLPGPRGHVGQNLQNTFIPPPDPTRLEYVEVREPVTGGASMDVPVEQVTVALEQSGIGDGSFAAATKKVAVVFDQAGRVADILTDSESTAPKDLVYFLFHDATDSSPPLQSTKAVWVAVNPQTGRVNVAANVPGSDLNGNRKNARTATAFGK